MTEKKVLFLTFASTVDYLQTYPPIVLVQESKELNDKLNEGWVIDEVRILGTHTQEVGSATLTQMTTALYNLSKTVG